MSYLVICVVLVGVNPGDLMLTRNAGGEDINQSPGWWNHAAIYAGNGQVVEAQAGKGVIVTPFKEFCNRYPYIMVLRPKGLCCHRLFVITDIAKRSVGRPYNLRASTKVLFFNFRQGDNCVSLVRSCYEYAYGFDPCWKIPDHIAEEGRLLRVESKGIK